MYLCDLSLFDAIIPLPLRLTSAAGCYGTTNLPVNLHKLDSLGQKSLVIYTGDLN